MSGSDVPYVFLSYASAERGRASVIADALEVAGVRVWLDREAIAGGASWGSEIVEGIKGCTALLICCTAAAMQSRNVKQEIQLAWRYEKAYLPLLLEPIQFPEQVQYFLEGWQWVEAGDPEPATFVPAVLRALKRLGIAGGSGQSAVGSGMTTNSGAEPPAAGLPPLRVDSPLVADAGTPTGGSRTAPTSASPSRAEPTPSFPTARSPLPIASAFAGREQELAILQSALDRAMNGSGEMVLLAGEPGVGKTRTVEQFAAMARGQGATVLWGRSYEGDWAPPYGPWVEALASYARAVEPEQLRRELGAGAGTIARLVAAVGALLPDVPAPTSVSPEEERFRLHDSVVQFLLAAAADRPLVLVLDDLHWADRDSIGLLRHVARFAGTAPLLLLGLYRDVDLDRQHPLAAALAELRRERGFERVLLRGLSRDEVQRFLEQRAGHAVPAPVVEALFTETEGNPFFLSEVLLHLQEEGRIVRQNGRWTATVSLREMGIPEGVREVVGRRLSRLSAETNRVLALASAFSGGFEFGVLQELARLPEATLLDTIDEALAAQVLRSVEGKGETYDFVHALIRRTLYDELSPSRKVRLHRQIAEALEHCYAGQEGRHAEALAYHFHESAALPNADRGVQYCVLAGDRAEAAAAWSQAAAYLRWALELLPDGDERRGRLLARLGLAAAWALEFDAAREALLEAGAQIAGSEGADAAADYLASAARTLQDAGSSQTAWVVGEHCLEYAGERRDQTWAVAYALALNGREATSAGGPGLVAATPEREALWAVTDRLPFEPFFGSGMFARPPASHELAMQRVERDLAAAPTNIVSTGMFVTYTGDYRRALPSARLLASATESTGQVNAALGAHAYTARCLIAVGDLQAAQTTIDHARLLQRRLAGFSTPGGTQLLDAAYAERAIATGTGWERMAQLWETALQNPRPEQAWVTAFITAFVARARAWLGSAEASVEAVRLVLPALEHGQGGAGNYPAIACDAAAALWLTNSTDRGDLVEVVERNLRDKVVGPDFRYPMRDARLSLAWLCALQGRLDEAHHWFAEARAVLDEQGARPLRAIVDHDEALALVRSGSTDTGRIAELHTAARAEFRAIGMPGWSERADLTLLSLP